MSLYNCKEIPNQGYTLSKFDEALNVEATYAVTNATCTCPAGVRPTCKHRSRLLPAFLLRKHVDDGWFLNDQNMMWHRPLVEVTPGMTDMMVAPETLDAFMEANPLPEEKPLDLATFKRRV